MENPLLQSTKTKKQKEELATNLVNESTISKNIRPSIETLLHSLLHKFVLHTHPILVNIITARKVWDEQLREIFPEALLIPYYTPGIELAIALKDALSEYQNKYSLLPSVIFLQNHGLIISSDNPTEIVKLNEDVLSKIELYLKTPPLDYKLTSSVSALLERVLPNNNLVIMLSDDSVVNSNIQSLLSESPFTPDICVFCGLEPLKLDNLSEVDPLSDYVVKHGTPPKVIHYKGLIFIAAISLRKAKEIEEVLKFQALVLKYNTPGEMNFLPADELNYLQNWEAEKYRQSL